MSRQKYCFICNSAHLRFRFTKKGKHFYRCSDCGFELQHPMPTDEDLTEYYEKSYREGLYKEFVAANNMKTVNAQFRFNKTKQFLKNKVLDVGCADGHFLQILYQNKIKAEGIDISENAVQQVFKKGLVATATKLENFKAKDRYNSIVAFDLIEHVVEPNKFMKDINNLLHNNGKLILSTPDTGSIYCKIMGKMWYFYIPEEHLIYFNRNNIAKLFLNHGFKIEKQSRITKALTLEYGLTQFKEYNPFIYKILKVVTSILPTQINRYPFQFYIGEMLCVSTKMKNL